MSRARKKQIHFAAFCLGEETTVEKEMIQEGKIRICDGKYEIFSQESKEGKGEIAYPGDYVKIDSQGFPYPNSKDFFEENCIKVGENLYQQIGSPVDVWFADDPISDFVAFLQKEERLHINEADKDRYFQAYLWGAPLSAARDAAVVAYSIERNAEGNILDVDFNFIERSEFEKTYELCDD